MDGIDVIPHMIVRDASPRLPARAELHVRWDSSVPLANLEVDVDVKAILTPPCILFYRESLMKYTGWCQNDFNVYAHLEADLDAGTPRISCFTSAALHEKAISWQATIFIISDSRYKVLRAAHRRMSFPPTLGQPMLVGQPAVQIFFSRNSRYKIQREAGE